MSHRFNRLLLVISVFSIVLNRRLIRDLDFDWLNLVFLLATLFIALCVLIPQKVLGLQFPSSGRLLQLAPKRLLLFWRWFRIVLLAVLLLSVAEYALRSASYHRTMLYERQGDLLFTPVPNQYYVEKVSLTRSRINNYGLRGPDLTKAELARRIILCLGDSVTYGYGVDNDHTYPALLQGRLEKLQKGKYRVLNAGVNAYPVALMREKFLYLSGQGILPEVVIVGYSHNEGLIPDDVIRGDENLKKSFENRVKLKNFLRSYALYNLVIENWGRIYYEKMRTRLIPGTHRISSAVDQEESLAEITKGYEGYLMALAKDLRNRNVSPIFLVASSYNKGRYSTEGPLQRRFSAFASNQGIPQIRTDLALQKVSGEDSNLEEYFLDASHMNPLGNGIVANELAELVQDMLVEKILPPSR